MQHRIAQLKELIAGVDLSDPFGLFDRARWQAELSALLDRSEREPTVVRRPRHPSKWNAKPKEGKKRATKPGSETYRVAPPKPAPPAPTARQKKSRATPTVAQDPVFRTSQRLWLPVAKWCEDQLRNLQASHGTPIDARLLDRPTRQALGAVGSFLGLVRSLLRATTPFQFDSALLQVQRFYQTHPQVRSAPVPQPTPTPSSVKPPKPSPSVRDGSRTPVPPASKPKNSTRVPPKVPKPRPEPSFPHTRRGGGFPAGESMASYNRLPLTTHGRSFEDSLALQQSDKYVRRSVVDRADRMMSSGSDEELAEIDD